MMRKTSRPVRKPNYQVGWAVADAWSPTRVRDGHLHWWLVEEGVCHTLCGVPGRVQPFSLNDINATRCPTCDGEFSRTLIDKFDQPAADV